MILMGQSRRFRTTIDEYPTGRYGICGGVPEKLCKENGQSKVWNTEEEVHAALLAIEWDCWQMADGTLFTNKNN